MTNDLAGLENKIGTAIGPSDGIDRAIAAALDGDTNKDLPPPYTASVDECIALVKRTLPGWHWHLGHGPLGIVPYASLTQNDGEDGSIHVEVTAPTVPLALLGALMKALNSSK